jgi:hypothetical protein
VFDIQSPDGPEKKDELIKLWQQRCPVYLSFLSNVEIRMK